MIRVWRATALARLPRSRGFAFRHSEHNYRGFWRKAAKPYQCSQKLCLGTGRIEYGDMHVEIEDSFHPLRFGWRLMFATRRICAICTRFMPHIPSQDIYK